jgi:hypothetical protein
MKIKSSQGRLLFRNNQSQLFLSAKGVFEKQTASIEINIMKNSLFLFLILFVQVSFGQVNQNNLSPADLDVECKILWQDAAYGKCMGENNNLIPYDFQNDGTIELIVNAKDSKWAGQTQRGYWYVLKYNPTVETYEKIFVSKFYSTPIGKITIADIDNSGDDELLVGENKTLHIYDLNTFTKVQTVNVGISIFDEILQIKFADGNNDGQDEIIISADSDFILLNPTDFSVVNSFGFESGDFDVGNVDNDSALEIVFNHGRVIQIDNEMVNEEVDLYPNINSNGGFVQVSDIDNDGIEEAIFPKDRLQAFDVENNFMMIDQSLAFFDVASLTLADLNDDGTEDIIMGQDDGGKMKAYDPITGDLILNTYENNEPVIGMAVADFDGDNVKEIAWGIGCGNNESDYIFFTDVITEVDEWKSIEITAPYHAIEIADVDEDGFDEILTLASNSEDDGGSGVLTIYDAISKNIEYQSPVGFFQYSSIGMHNIEVVDHLNDGDLDIILSGDRAYRGKFWVLDGDTRIIESESNYGNGEVTSIFSHVTTDVDGDGDQEFVALGLEVYIINSNDFTIEWKSTNISSTSDPKNILVGNVDADLENEIIFCNKKITKIEVPSYTHTQSISTHYNTFELFNWDTSTPQLEIIAGTTNGTIEILDGATLAVLNTFDVSSEEINGIKITDFNHDGVNEILVSSSSKIFFINETGETIYSQSIDDQLGDYDGIAFKDYDGDGLINILIGSEYKVTEVNAGCSNCLNFEPEISYINPKCGEDNGMIIGLSTDSVTTYLGNEFSFLDTLFDLPEDLYAVTATSDFGCSVGLDFQLIQQDFIVQSNFANQSCLAEDAYINTNILEGLAPYTYLWSTGDDTSALTNLSADTYNLTITDANGCIHLDTFNVLQSAVNGEVDFLFPSCEGSNNGAAGLNIWAGTPPYDILWDNTIIGGQSINALSAGTHNVFITDSLGCTQSINFNVAESILNIETNPLSLSCNGNFSGSAEVNILLGNEPYAYNWSNGLATSNFINNLPSGLFTVTVTDQFNCTSVDSVLIESSILTAHSESVDVDCFGDDDGSTTIFVDEGILPFIYEWDIGGNTDSKSNLEAGNYFILITDSLGCQIVESVQVESPDELELGLIITPDNSSTSENDGSIFTNIMGGTPPYYYIWEDGTTADSLINLAEGEYFLTLLDANNCEVDTIIMVDLFTSIEELEDIQINIYPNPTSDYLFLESKIPNAFQNIMLFSIDGKKLIVPNNQSNLYQNELNLSHLATGKYLLIFEIEEALYFKKIVVSH